MTGAAYGNALDHNLVLLANVVVLYLVAVQEKPIITGLFFRYRKHGQHFALSSLPGLYQVSGNIVSGRGFLVGRFDIPGPPYVSLDVGGGVDQLNNTTAQNAHGHEAEKNLG